MIAYVVQTLEHQYVGQGSLHDPLGQAILFPDHQAAHYVSEVFGGKVRRVSLDLMPDPEPTEEV